MRHADVALNQTYNGGRFVLSRRRRTRHTRHPPHRHTHPFARRHRNAHTTRTVTRCVPSFFPPTRTGLPVRLRTKARPRLAAFAWTPRESSRVGVDRAMALPCAPPCAPPRTTARFVHAALPDGSGGERDDAAGDDGARQAGRADAAPRGQHAAVGQGHPRRRVP